jgi:DeoR/GlpR family transcriptional regulator of sugar metabolism
MLKAAGRVIVVADSSKFGQKSLTLVSALEKVNVFVSDDGLSAAWRERIAKAGARLIVAEVPPSEADAGPVSPISRRNRPA